MRDILTSKDYKDALDVQDACNLSGVVIAFARVMEKICNVANDKGLGTEWKNNHAIARMYSSKIESLTAGAEDPAYEFMKAYEECEKMANPEEVTS